MAPKAATVVTSGTLSVGSRAFLWRGSRLTDRGQAVLLAKHSVLMDFLSLAE
jgi:hypothetical protein